MSVRPLTMALPKGRILEKLVPLLGAAGVDTSELERADRTLIRHTADQQLTFLLLKPDDVPTYVEYGAADIGISGRDTLLERRYDLYQPLDLQIGICRMVVAGLPSHELPEQPRVATKFPYIAERHFAKQGIQAEIIYAGGSVELAPLVGLSDLIVDLVESGDTLRANGLVEFETICDISSVLVANRAQFKLRYPEISRLVKRLRAQIEG